MPDSGLRVTKIAGEIRVDMMLKYDLAEALFPTVKQLINAVDASEWSGKFYCVCKLAEQCGIIVRMNLIRNDLKQD